MSGAPPRGAGLTAGVVAADFARIDWSAPWLAHYAEPGRTLQAAALEGEAALLSRLGPRRIALLAAAARPPRPHT